MILKDGRARKERRMQLEWMSLIVLRGTQPQAWGEASGGGNSHRTGTLRDTSVQWDPWVDYWCSQR